MNRILSLALLFLPLLVSRAQEVVLPPHFRDHMVLQRNARNLIFGQAAPKQKVWVQFGKSGPISAVTADPNGSWSYILSLGREENEPQRLQIFTGTKKMD